MQEPAPRAILALPKPECGMSRCGVPLIAHRVGSYRIRAGAG
jgi:hypothetical protein